MKTLAIFDLDGTITDKDTLIEFLSFVNGRLYTYLIFLLLFPLIILFKLKLLHNEKFKKIVLSIHFKGKDEQLLKAKAKDFIQKIDQCTRASMQEKLNWHKENNHSIVILTASCDLWVEPWTQKYGYQLIGTELKFKDGVYSGNFSTKNCYGKEKVNRLNKVLDLNSFDKFYAYGDSKSDRFYIDLADEKIWV